MSKVMTRTLWRRSRRLRPALIAILVVLSLVLTIFELGHTQKLQEHLGEISWIGTSLLVTEAIFVIGAVIMAIAAGEAFFGAKRITQWPRHILTLRRNTRALAEKMITSRLFGVGFWLNFVGAVGTSLILMTAVLLFAPYTGAGIAVVIIIDLVATFGWRVPLELARRKALKHGQH